MGTLGFVCPTTGREVDTGIEVDSLSFTSLHSEQLGCPECLETHQLSLIKVWVAEMGQHEPSDLALTVHLISAFRGSNRSAVARLTRRLEHLGAVPAIGPFIFGFAQSRHC